jgi:hypothetical protein
MGLINYDTLAAIYMAYKQHNMSGYYNLFIKGENPIFIPRKHTKQTYASQRREAKQRKKRKNR